MKRKEVYEIIDKERDYQERLSVSTFRHDDVDQSVPAELVMMKVYLDKAFNAYTANYGDQFALADVRKVTALGIRCLERHGCPRRSDEEDTR